MSLTADFNMDFTFLPHQPDTSLIQLCPSSDLILDLHSTFDPYLTLIPKAHTRKH